jgi:hypothetical protein
MKNNLKIEGISIEVTDNQTRISGSLKLKESSEVIQQGEKEWSILVYSKFRNLSDQGLKKLRRLASLMIWNNQEKIGNLREIRKNLTLTINNDALWKKVY